MAEASYIPLTEEALDDLKEYIKRCVSHAEYRSGGRTRSQGSASITKTAFCGLAAMKA